MSLNDLTFHNADSSNLIPEDNFGKREKKDFNDPRFFKPSIKNSKSKNPEKLPDEYQALIRVLPRGLDFSVPYLQEYKEHNFSVSGKYFIQKCRKTLGDKENCPVCTVKWDIWNTAKKTNDELGQKRAKEMMDKSTFICNVLVIKDAINPANNGKVMLWKIPAAIRNMIIDAQKNGVTNKPASQFAEASDTVSIPPFIAIDPIRGRNIGLIVNLDTKQMVSYASSTWQNAAKEQPLATNPDGTPNEALIREKLAECNDLKEFIQDVKSVDTLTKEFADWQSKVTGQLIAGNGGSNVGVSGFNSMSESNSTLNTTPNVKKPEMGNPSELFGNQVNNSMQPSVQMIPPTPSVTPTMSQTKVDTVSEDDLPF